MPRCTVFGALRGAVPALIANLYAGPHETMECRVVRLLAPRHSPPAPLGRAVRFRALPGYGTRAAVKRA